MNKIHIPSLRFSDYSDEWELKNGLNPEDSADGNQTDEQGFTNLEKYMNSIVAEITEGQNEGGIILNGIEKSDTGIAEIICKGNNKDTIYNLQGIRIALPKKGVYICNGKKSVFR